jgi:electron transfer flavoprotein alpha subunit
MPNRIAEILIYSNEERMLPELISAAYRSGVDSVGLVLLADEIEQDDKDHDWGVDTVFFVENPHLGYFNPESYTDALSTVIEQVNPYLVLIGATKEDIELSARVAGRLGVGIASWCVSFNLNRDNGELLAQCMLYSGVGFCTYSINTMPAMVTVAPGSFACDQLDRKEPEWVKINVDIPEPHLKVLQEKGKMAAGMRLEDAPVIVDVGMGLEAKEDLTLAQELADIFNGQVSCTRPIATERDWFPEWVGLSGAKLSPALCFTIGVSGAVQHMIGIRGSEVIVAVNKDEHAGIHLQADYSVVADLTKFVPELIMELKKRSVTLS